MATETLSTTCTMDCPDSCALDVTVENGRIARIAAGVGAHPNTNGFICDKVQQFGKRVYHQDRILHPMRRIGAKGDGEFAQITWDEALDEIAERYQHLAAQYGAESIVPYHYGGSNGMLGDCFLDHYFFARLGASRLARTLCAAPASEVATSMYGKMPGVAYEDYPAAKYIIIWGANPKASNIHLTPYLKQAKRNGAFIAVIDPVCNFTSQEIDLHIPVYPGADLPVALALANYLKHDAAFLAQYTEQAGPLLEAASHWTLERAADAARVDVASLRELASRYAELQPAVIRAGWGIERNRNGGQALAAILALPALAGKFGVRGGGYTLSNGSATKFDAPSILGDMPWTTRILNMSRIGELLLGEADPAIRAMFVYNCNPVATAPDQNRVIEGLMRDDLFTVVHEQVTTDTVLYADIVLPSVTFLEQYEIKRGYGSYMVGGVRPVIDACGEAKPNEWVFAALGRRMGFTEDPFSWDSETCMRKIAEVLTIAGNAADTHAIMTGKIQLYNFPGSTPVQFATVRPPTGKANLTPASLGARPYAFDPVESAEYPLALISPSNSKMISSTLGEFNYPELFVTLHPVDAEPRGITDGDAVRVYNELGEVECRARVCDRVRTGVAAIPKGAWRKSSRNGQTSNALSPAHVNVVAGGACYNDARVEIARR